MAAEQHHPKSSSSSKLKDSSLPGVGVDEIEQASDDDIEDEHSESVPARRRGRRRVRDLDYAEEGEGIDNAEEESEEAPLDDLEPESIIDHEEEERLKQQKKT